MLIFVLVLFLNFYTSLAVFTPADSAALKAAVGTCSWNGVCTGGCLGETGDGSCPTLAGTVWDGDSDTYGVMGDWDVSQVTSLDQSTSCPHPLVSVVLSLEFHSLPLLLFLRFLDFYFWILSTHGTDILLQRSMVLLHSTRIFPTGTLRR
mgnify:CR=1 FL=1